MSGLPLILVNALVAKVKAAIPAFAEVYSEWPDMNQTLVMPSMSIRTAEPRYTRGVPYQTAFGVVVGNRATDTYCVGEWEILLQLDIWSRYKAERDTLYASLWSMLEPPAREGCQMQLTSYFNEWVKLTQMGFRHLDSDDSVSRKEWRSTVSVVANCRAMNTVSEYIITQAPELVFSTPDTIT